MTSEQMTFLSVLGCSVSGREILNKESFDKNQNIESMTYTHQCIPLVYQSCVWAGMKVPDMWKYQTIYSPINNAHKLSVQKKVCDKLSVVGIKFAIFKGSSVAINYPNPDLRGLGDIDILVSEKDFEKAILQFVDEIKEEDAWHKFHFAVTVDDVTVELHKYITYKTDDEEWEKLSEVMFHALDEVVYKKYDKWEFPTLQNKYHALALLHHKRRHLYKNNFVLRMLCDWACFVKSVDQKEWNEEVYPLIKEVSMDIFADAFTKCADKYLGFSNHTKTKNVIDEDVIDNLIEVLISCGLSKDRNNFLANIGALYSKYNQKHGRIVSFVKTVNEISKKKYSFAKKVYLLPFAWICMLFSFVFRKKSKKAELNMIKVDFYARKRNKLYNDLNLKGM